MLLAICDDEPAELETIKEIFSQAAAERHTDIQISAYPSGGALLNAVEAGARPALTLLDIYMTGGDGLETAHRLRELLPEAAIAFLTASREHAVDAFELEALHYLLKPVTPEKAQALLSRFLGRQPEYGLTLTYGQERIHAGTIRYLTSLNRGTMFYLTGQSHGRWLSCTFREEVEQLAGNPDFLQISRGCIVNLNAVQYIGHENCHMKNGEPLPVSRRARQEVRNRYNDFLFRKMNQAKEGLL